MNEIKFNVKGVDYVVDLDNLEEKVNFSITQGRRFSLEGTNSEGKKERHNLKLNDIFEAILTNLDSDKNRIEIKNLSNTFDVLKNVGYEKGFMTGALQIFNKIFKGSERDRIDLLMTVKESGLDKLQEKAEEHPADVTISNILTIRSLYSNRKGVDDLLNKVVGKLIEKEKTASSADKAKINLVLAYCYSKGIGVKKNQTKALELCKQYSATNSDDSREFLNVANYTISEKFKKNLKDVPADLKDLWSASRDQKYKSIADLKK